jgi:hypothetical protein
MFLTLRPRALWNINAWKSPVLNFHLSVMLALAVLSVAAVVLTAACILMPLLFSSQRSDLGVFTLLTFFAAIGAGFILIELSQMQRLMIFLGNPSYALSVVLFVLLISSGLGSFVAERLVRNGNGKDVVFLALLPLLIISSLFGPVTPYALERFASSTTPARIFVACVMLFPVGFFMGMPFTIGMKAANSKSPALMPWLWAVDAATSVCASVLSIIIAYTAGLSVVYWCGVFCYFTAIVALAATDLGARQRIDYALVA